MTAKPVARFTLTDHHGRRVSETSFGDRLLLVYFGFTHCRVVCPRTLGKLSAVIDRLDDDVRLIAPLYITTDPDRDTPEVMREYLHDQYPRFTGLTGTQAEIEAAKAAFRVFAARKDDPDDPDGYAVPHTAITYFMDADGQYLTHFTDTADGDMIFHSIATTLRAARQSAMRQST